VRQHDVWCVMCEVMCDVWCVMCEWKKSIYKTISTHMIYLSNQLKLNLCIGAYCRPYIYARCLHYCVVWRRSITRKSSFATTSRTSSTFDCSLHFKNLSFHMFISFSSDYSRQITLRNKLKENSSCCCICARYPSMQWIGQIFRNEIESKMRFGRVWTI